MKILNTAQQAANGCKVLVYGRSGAGKTRLCATAPAPLILSAEKGLLSLRKESVAFAEINTVKELDEAHDWLWRSAEARQFATVCLDSVSEIAETILAHEKITAGKDPRRAYGPMMDRITGLFRSFRDIPAKNVVFISKAEFVKDELTGVTLWGPAMPGQKLGQQVPYYFDEVWYLHRYNDPTYGDIPVLRCRANNQFDAKDRSGMLAEIEHANLTALFHKMTQG